MTARYSINKRDIISFLLHPQRLARLIEQSARDNTRLSALTVINRTLARSSVKSGYSSFESEIARMVEKLVVHRLLQLAGDQQVMRQVSALAWYKINQLEKQYTDALTEPSSTEQAMHHTYLLEQIAQFKKEPGDYKMPPAPSMPDGSPIGCGE